MEVTRKQRRLQAKEQQDESWGKMVKRDWKRHYPLYIMLIPMLLFYIIWCYAPMYGIQIAFKEFSPRRGIWGSEWVGLKNFYDFFNGAFAWRTIRNTFLISIYSLIFTFPLPILFAVLLNEIKNVTFKRTIQTVSYLPYFISLVVLCGIIVDFTASTGVFGEIQRLMGRDPVNLLGDAKYFRTIYIVSEIWQRLGWDSIIFLAALASINTELFEAAKIDGANRFRQIWHISIPGIVPTIVILLILRIGGIMSVGYEKIILLYSGLTYETADVISSFVYRKGLVENNFGYATAVGLFNSVVNVTLVVSANAISRKLTDTSLW